MDSSALYGKQSTENHGRLSLFGQSACPYSTYRFIFQTYFAECFKLRVIMSTNQKHGTCGIVSKLERFQNLHFSQSLLQMKSIPKRIKKLNSLFLMLLSFKYSDDVSYRLRYVSSPRVPGQDMSGRGRANDGKLDLSVRYSGV